MQAALCTAIGFAIVVGVVPASHARESQVADQGRPAGTAIDGRQTREGLERNSGISLAVPTGKISVDTGSAGGEPVYVRRSTVRDRMTIVEVSTTPFMPVLASNEAIPVLRPDQPAPW